MVVGLEELRGQVVWPQTKSEHVRANHNDAGHRSWRHRPRTRRRDWPRELERSPRAVCMSDRTKYGLAFPSFTRVILAMPQHRPGLPHPPSLGCAPTGPFRRLVSTRPLSAALLVGPRPTYVVSSRSARGCSRPISTQCIRSERRSFRQPLSRSLRRLRPPAGRGFVAHSRSVKTGARGRQRAHSLGAAKGTGLSSTESVKGECERRVRKESAKGESLRGGPTVGRR